MSSRKRRKEERKTMFKQFCFKCTDKTDDKPKSDTILKNSYSISYIVGPQIFGHCYSLQVAYLTFS